MVISKVAPKYNVQHPLFLGLATPISWLGTHVPSSYNLMKLYLSQTYVNLSLTGHLGGKRRDLGCREKEMGAKTRK